MFSIWGKVSGFNVKVGGVVCAEGMVLRVAFLLPEVLQKHFICACLYEVGDILRARVWEGPSVSEISWNVIVFFFFFEG